MIDDGTILLINAYVDGELSPTETLAMERRLESEPHLRAFVDQLRNVSSRVSNVLVLEPAPERLRATIVSAIGFSDVASAPRTRAVVWASLAASLLVGAALGAWLNGPLSPWSSNAAPSITDMVFAAHLRGLSASQPFDIASSDNHVVKPWFNGRTTIAPAAPDLAGEGFPLIGGRIDIVRDTAVPTLVYRRDRHIISVTVIPSTPEIGEHEQRRDGSMIKRWVSGNLTYLATSDLNATDLRRFVTLFRDASR